jgi:hypothetical protein
MPVVPKKPRQQYIHPNRRLDRIREIIEEVDNRCLHADGPVTPTMEEITQDELSRIYAHACRKPETWTPK